MSRLLLFISLEDDDRKTVDSLIGFLEQTDAKIRFSRDGVTRLSQNVYLFEETTAHGLLVTLQAAACRRSDPYLLVPIESTLSLLVGTPPKDIQGILEKFGVPSCPSL